jgi:hypothetical protein
MRGIIKSDSLRFSANIFNVPRQGHLFSQPSFNFVQIASREHEGNRTMASLFANPTTSQHKLLRLRQPTRAKPIAQTAQDFTRKQYCTSTKARHGGTKKVKGKK